MQEGDDAAGERRAKLISRRAVPREGTGLYCQISTLLSGIIK